MGSASACSPAAEDPFFTFPLVSRPRLFALLALVVALAPAGCALGGDDAPEAQPVAADGPPPVVVVVFDEFPADAVLKPGGEIDAERFPNFAALARTSTWFRNGHTIYDSTFKAVPAILDARLPRPRTAADVRSHQPSVYHLMNRLGYGVVRVESGSALCPPWICADGRTRRPGVLSRLAGPRAPGAPAPLDRRAPPTRSAHVLLSPRAAPSRAVALSAVGPAGPPGGHRPGARDQPPRRLAPAGPDRPQPPAPSAPGGLRRPRAGADPAPDAPHEDLRRRPAHRRGRPRLFLRPGRGEPPPGHRRHHRGGRAGALLREAARADRGRGRTTASCAPSTSCPPSPRCSAPRSIGATTAIRRSPTKRATVRRWRLTGATSVGTVTIGREELEAAREAGAPAAGGQVRYGRREPPGVRRSLGLGLPHRAQPGSAGPPRAARPCDAVGCAARAGGQHRPPQDVDRTASLLPTRVAGHIEGGAAGEVARPGAGAQRPGGRGGRELSPAWARARVLLSHGARLGPARRPQLSSAAGGPRGRLARLAVLARGRSGWAPRSDRGRSGRACRSCR